MSSGIISKIARETVTVGKKVNGVWRYVAYIRVSTKAQGEVQHGSPEQQRHMIRRWAERKSEDSGFQIILYFIEEEISGAEDAISRRHGFQAILHAIKTKAIDGLVAEKLDRLGRSQNHLYDLAKFAEEKGVALHEVESGVVNLKDRSNRMGFKIKSMFAEEYSLELKEKIPKKQREARVNNGKDTSTWPILGLDAHPTKTCMYVNNPVEGKQVLSIAQRCIELGGVGNELVAYCTERGYKTKVRLTKEKIDKEGNRIPPRRVGGEPFDVKSLRYLLTNPKLRGTGRFLDTWNQFPKLQDASGYVDFKYAHDPVIPPELFDRVQAVLHEKAMRYGRSGKDRTVYLLSGIFCTSDGRRFQGGRHNGGQNAYYQTADREIMIPKDKVEDAVRKRVKQYIRESGTIEKIISTALKHRLTGLPLIDEDIRDVKAKIGTLEKTLGGFSQALREAVSSNPANVVEVTNLLLEEKKKAEDEFRRAEDQLKALEAKRGYVSDRFQEKTLQDYMRKVMERFDEESDAIRKRLVQTIIPKVIYHPGEKRLELFINPDPESSGLSVSPTGCHGPSGGTNLRVSSKWRAALPNLEDFNAMPELQDSLTFSHVPAYKDEFLLHQKYVVQSLSIAQIAAELFASKDAVRRGLQAAGIPIREAHKPHGRPSQPRYGEKIRQGKAEPHLAEQRVIRAVLDLHAQKLSLRQIARCLNQIGVPTKCRGKAWHPEMVRRVLAASNPPKNNRKEFPERSTASLHY